MKKIMFNDKYGLTTAVLQGRKTMTRRVLPQDKIDGRWDYNSYYDYCLKCKRLGKNEITWDKWLILHHGKYKIGEVVAIAQSYKDAGFSPNDIIGYIDYGCNMYGPLVAGNVPGWNNKMFVKAEFMPNFICITDIRMERLQEISHEDCLKEGILYQDGYFCGYKVSAPNMAFGAMTAQQAFAALIDKVSGRGTWQANPWVLAYSYELVK